MCPIYRHPGTGREEQVTALAFLGEQQRGDVPAILNGSTTIKKRAAAFVGGKGEYCQTPTAVDCK